MKRRLEDALQDCLAALETDRATVEECLARYPDLAADLKPLLLMGRRLQEVFDVDPSPLYAEAARQRFLAALASRCEARFAPPSPSPSPARKNPGKGLLLVPQAPTRPGFVHRPASSFADMVQQAKAVLEQDEAQARSRPGSGRLGWRHADGW